MDADIEGGIRAPSAARQGCSRMLWSCPQSLPVQGCSEGTVHGSVGASVIPISALSCSSAGAVRARGRSASALRLMGMAGARLC